MLWMTDEGMFSIAILAVCSKHRLADGNHYIGLV